MKKLVFMLVLVILMFNLIFLAIAVAQQGQGQQVQMGDSDNESGDVGVQQNQGQEQNLVVRNEIRARMTLGNEEEVETEQGERVMLKLKENNKIQLRTGNVSAECLCNLSEEKIQNRTRLSVQLSNGINSEIKIMPDAASERALERLQLRVCSSENNCTIELKEVAVKRYENNEYFQQRPAYEVRAEKQSKLFGLFKKKMQVQAQVDAETGEVVASKKPWWAFLGSEE